jgi:tetratricopeptide (TPR) repeat protein
MHYDEGDYAEALRWFQAAMPLVNEKFLRERYIRSLMALSLIEVGRAPEALGYVKAGYEADPEDAFRAICFARVLAALGNYPQANAILGAIQANGLAPGLHEDLLVHKCWLFAKAGDRVHYQECYSMLKALYPASPALNDPTRARWLPPPERMQWPEVRRE